MSTSWRPAASIDRLRRRSRLIARLRAFLEARGLWEVETQILDTVGTTDPHIHPLSTEIGAPHAPRRLYLHTSPEFHMKRLLAAGSGPIYQIARVFRDQERGPRHLLEFTLLEWYRPGWDHRRLMDEVAQLLCEVAEAPPARRLSYRQVFQQHLGVDPHHTPTEALHELARDHGLTPPDDLDRDALLDLLMGALLEPRLGQDTPLFIHDYPASQAALARIRPGDPPLAERFELYWRGMELANGFHELTDPEEQRRRFLDERRRRRQHGLADIPHDQWLIEALEAGLPPCAGVALGVDRLFMILSEAENIDQVVAFPQRI